MTAVMTLEPPEGHVGLHGKFAACFLMKPSPKLTWQISCSSNFRRVVKQPEVSPTVAVWFDSGRV